MQWGCRVPVLTSDMSLRETLWLLSVAQGEPCSRFVFGSPCRFVRGLDIAVHVVVPELLEGVVPGLARYLRLTSPRWGRSWRDW